MNKLMRAFVFLTASLACTPLHAQQRVKSNVTQAVVYLQGAQVKHSAYVKVSPGNSEIIFEGLSNYIDPNSIEILGGSNLTILSVNYRLNPSAFNEKPVEVKALKTQLDTARMKLSYVQNERFALEQEIQMLQDNRKLPDSDNSIFIEDVQEMADYYRKRLMEIKNRVVRLQIEEAEQSAKVNELQRKYNEATSAGQLASGEIAVKIASTSYNNVNFVIRYYTHQAGWKPFYSLRADANSQNVQLDYDAQVFQSTGAEWNNARLVLTTTNPVLGAQKPEMHPRYVSIPQSVPVRKEAVSSGAYIEHDQTTSPQTYTREDAYSPSYPSDYTSVVQSNLNTSFNINLSYDIPSDGKEHLVRIQQHQVPATFSYVAMPGLSDNAFLNAKLTGWEQYNLLPGTANIFYEGTYVGKAQIDPSVTTDTLDISFGRDEHVNIKRTRIQDFTTKQFLGSTQKQTFGYVISVRNTKNANMEITVMDQVPVSKNKEIEIEVQEKSNATYDPNTGFLSWKLDVPAMDSKTLQFIYSVKSPKGQQLLGIY